MSGFPHNITAYTEITQEDMKDPSLALLNTLLKNSAQAVGTTQAAGQSNAALIAQLQAQIASLQQQIDAIGQPSAASSLSASGTSSKVQAQQGLNALASLGTGGASVVAVPAGGTGQKTLTQHGLVIGEGTAAVNVVAPGTAGQVLTSKGTGSDPDFEDAQLLGNLQIGGGANTNLQAPAQGSGGGPASLTVIRWVYVKVNGTNYYIGLFQ